jgi:hypothetical protein
MAHYREDAELPALCDRLEAGQPPPPRPDAAFASRFWRRPTSACTTRRMTPFVNADAFHRAFAAFGILHEEREQFYSFIGLHKGFALICKKYGPNHRGAARSESHRNPPIGDMALLAQAAEVNPIAVHAGVQMD